MANKWKACTKCRQTGQIWLSAVYVNKVLNEALGLTNHLDIFPYVYC